MDKQQILSLIDEKIKEGVITSAEVQARLGASQEVSKSEEGSATKITYILYAIGALIAGIGIIVLLMQYWNEIGFAGRILVTLGISIVLYVSALCMKGAEHRVISQVLLIGSAILAPIGVLVIFREFELDPTALLQVVVSGALALVFGFAYWYSQRNILILAVLAFLSYGYFGLFQVLTINSGSVMKWAVCILGISFALFAYYLEQKNKTNSTRTIEESKERESIQVIIYLIGTAMVLGSMLTFGGIFDLIVLLPIFAAIYGSVFIRSKMMLFLSTIFLVIYVIKITAKYFATSIGWPLTLIVIGFLIIAVAYLAIYLSKKYIKSNPAV